MGAFLAVCIFSEIKHIPTNNNDEISLGCNDNVMKNLALFIWRDIIILRKTFTTED